MAGCVGSSSFWVKGIRGGPTGGLEGGQGDARGVSVWGRGVGLRVGEAGLTLEKKKVGRWSVGKDEGARTRLGGIKGGEGGFVFFRASGGQRGGGAQPRRAAKKKRDPDDECVSSSSHSPALLDRRLVSSQPPFQKGTSTRNTRTHI